MTIEIVSAREGHGGARSRAMGYQVRRTAFPAAQMMTDLIILVAMSHLSLKLTKFLHPETAKFAPAYEYVYVSIMMSLALVLSYFRCGIYRLMSSRGNQIQIFGITTRYLLVAIILLTGCLFLAQMSDEFSRVWLIIWSATSAAGLCAARLIAAGIAERLIKGGVLTKTTAIVGASELGAELATHLVQGRSGTCLLGVFDQRRSGRRSALPGNIVMYDLSDLEKLLRRGWVDEVVIAIPPLAFTRILELAQRFHPFPVTVRVVAPRGYQNFRALDSAQYGQIVTFRVMDKPLDEIAVVIKWLEDKIIGALCFLIALPLMVFIAGAIKLDSRGPVFFKQKRLGANNLSFDLFKFRSMYAEQADLLGQQLTRNGDPRVTRVGRILRRTSIDELPQLINVLRGEMSLVGPRPHAVAASAGGVVYARAVNEYPIRHRVKPGITGWAQVNGWRGETTRIEQIQRRVEHDLYYIENWSVSFDFIILFRTIFAVLSSQNAV